MKKFVVFALVAIMATVVYAQWDGDPARRARGATLGSTEQVLVSGIANYEPAPTIIGDGAGAYAYTPFGEETGPTAPFSGTMTIHFNDSPIDDFDGQEIELALQYNVATGHGAQDAIYKSGEILSAQIYANPPPHDEYGLYFQQWKYKLTIQFRKVDSVMQQPNTTYKWKATLETWYRMGEVGTNPPWVKQPDVYDRGVYGSGGSGAFSDRNGWHVREPEEE